MLRFAGWLSPVMAAKNSLSRSGSSYSAAKKAAHPLWPHSVARPFEVPRSDGSRIHRAGDSPFPECRRYTTVYSYPETNPWQACCDNCFPVVQGIRKQPVRRENRELTSRVSRVDPATSPDPRDAWPRSNPTSSSLLLSRNSFNYGSYRRLSMHLAVAGQQKVCEAVGSCLTLHVTFHC